MTTFMSYRMLIHHSFKALRSLEKFCMKKYKQNLTKKILIVLLMKMLNKTLNKNYICNLNKRNLRKKTLLYNIINDSKKNLKSNNKNIKKNHMNNNRSKTHSIFLCKKSKKYFQKIPKKKT